LAASPRFGMALQVPGVLQYSETTLPTAHRRLTARLLW
jgi:hypothetical protein